MQLTAKSQHANAGSLSQCVGIQGFVGTVDYSGRLRTSGVANGFAGLWINVIDAKGKSLAMDNMKNRGVTGTTDWTEFHVKLAIPAGATLVCYGVLLTGDGQIWVDDINIDDTQGH